MATLDKRDVTALILAAGTGERLGQTAKAFLEHQGETLIEHVAALCARTCGAVIIGVAPVDKSRAADALAGQGVAVHTGGATRQETVGNLLRHAETEWVVVHEVARPFATGDLFARLLATAGGHDAVAPMARLQCALPAKKRDGIVYEHGDLLSLNGNAESRVALQTPQLYRWNILAAAYEKAAKNDWLDSSTAALVRRAGYRVKLIEGEPNNIKLTYPEDLELLIARR